MAAEETGMGRRALFVVIVAVILAGLAAVVAGFATERFLVTGIGLAAIVVATITLVVVRPQQTNWLRRFGTSAVGVGLAMLVAGLLGWGDAGFRLAAGGVFAGLGLSLLAIDAVRRRSRLAKTGPGAA